MTEGESGWVAGPYDALTDVPGIRVGHWTDRRAATGCTVILCQEGMAAAVDVRGGAPGTRETDVLALPNLVRRCHAVVFSGGSAFGLAAADGVVRWLREHDAGFPTTAGKVPIVSAAVVFDLGIGRSDAAPGPDEGYAAARRARGGRVPMGSVGAGTGTTVAKLLGRERCFKGGVGTASVIGPRGIIVGALAVTNAVGNIIDPQTGAAVAAPRTPQGGLTRLPEVVAERTASMDALVENTTLVCVATNAVLDPAQLQRLAYAAHDGLARVVVPAHTIGDGDTAFALSSGQLAIPPHEALTVHILGQQAVEAALLRSVRLASPIAGVPAAP